MKHHIFFEGTPDPSYILDFESSLFNFDEHRLLQQAERWMSFYILHEKQKKIVACIHFNILNEIAHSLFKSPFGSIEFSQNLSAPILFQFLEFVEQELKSKHVSKVVIKMPPHAYGNNEALLATFYLNKGYIVSKAETSSIIEITEDKIEKAYHRSEKRRFKKAQRAGLAFREIPINNLNEIYSFIENCRGKKGYKLSLGIEQLEQTVSKFENRYFLFGAFHNEQLAAAAITIRVKNEIMYDFYHDHAKEYDHLSPVVFLVEGITNFCHQHHIKLLDLGTSSVNGLPNFGLLTFKMRLGAKTSPKLTFEKNLN